MNLFATGRDLRRLNEIATILFRYGFADLVRRLGLARVLEQAGRLVRQPTTPSYLAMEPPERLRHALEEMGPTFIKLGQILATRVDLFPPEWIREFEKLQDTGRPVPYEELAPRIADALGRPVDQVFRRIDPEPIGVASIGQVHRAVTRRGEQVVLKIRKPGIRQKVAADLRLLDFLARLAADNSAELRRYRPVDLVREFDRSLQRELDFSVEARNADRIRDNMRDFAWLHVPRVYWEYSSAALQVQEYIDGIPARQLERIEDAGLDPALIARRGARVAWKMALEDGFFHADPHPGNFLILPDNHIAMLDFGMVGRLSGPRQEQMVQIMKAVVLQDAALGASVLASWSEGQPVDLPRLTADLEDVIANWAGLPLAEVDIAALLAEIAALLRRHQLVLPGDIALLIKAIITLEGFGRLMNPDFDLMREAEPLLRRMMRQRYRPARLVRSLGLRALDAVDRLYAPPAPGLPAGDAGAIDPRHLERLAARLERSQFRLVQTLLTAAGVLAGALLLAGRVPPTVWDVSVPGLLIFLGGSSWAAWLMLVARRHLREWE